MKFRTLALFLAATCVALCRFTPSAAAQSLEVAGIFNGDAGQPNGRLVEKPAGVIYGTTYYGGRLARGAIFRLTVGPPAVLEEVHAFSGPDGWGAGSGLVPGPAGYMYGVGGGGGLFGQGTIYRVDPSGRVTTVRDLRPEESGVGDLCLASDGSLYGTSASGGAARLGTVFRLDPDGSMHVLHEFTGADGARPNGGLIQASDGRLYGTTLSSGAGFDPPSTFFRIDLAGNFESLHTFAVDDGYVTPVVQAPDGYLYGGSYYGGSQGAGMIFRVDTDGNFEKLHDVDYSAGEGSDVRTVLLPAPDGNLWGTTYQGGGAGGVIFKISPSGAWTTVHPLGFAECANPSSPLLLGSGGWLYGTCQHGAQFTSEMGSVFRIDTGGNFEMLWSLRNTDGQLPEAGVVEGLDGSLYGTTDAGGVSGHGTFFRLSPSGQFEFLYEFGPGPGIPSPLTRAADGTIYGMAAGNGDMGHGFIFQYSTSGDFSVLHSFGVTEGSGASALVEASDGNFYCAAPGGGGGGLGSVFRMSAGGAVTTVHEFQPSEAQVPNHLLQAADGLLYFTATTPAGQYAIFRLGLDGMNFQTVAPFPASTGTGPTGLIQATNGDFYGTAFFGPLPYAGNVFHMDATATITSLHDFSGDDGIQPFGGIIQASDGNLYGTTLSGGATTYGTVFRRDDRRRFRDLVELSWHRRNPSQRPPDDRNGRFPVRNRRLQPWHHFPLAHFAGLTGAGQPCAGVRSRVRQHGRPGSRNSLSNDAGGHGGKCIRSVASRDRCPDGSRHDSPAGARHTERRRLDEPRYHLRDPAPGLVRRLPGHGFDQPLPRIRRIGLPRRRHRRLRRRQLLRVGLGHARADGRVSPEGRARCRVRAAAVHRTFRRRAPARAASPSTGSSSSRSKASPAAAAAPTSAPATPCAATRWPCSC